MLFYWGEIVLTPNGFSHWFFVRNVYFSWTAFIEFKLLGGGLCLNKYKKTPEEIHHQVFYVFLFSVYLNSTGSKYFTGTAFPRCFPGFQSFISFAIR